MRGWIDDFGADRIALAFDVRLDAGGAPCIVTHGWQRQSTRPLWEALADFPAGAPAHVLCTDVARDGALAGPNSRPVCRGRAALPRHRLAGIRRHTGCGGPKALAACGAAAAISGKALLEELIPVEELRPFLPNA